MRLFSPLPFLLLLCIGGHLSLAAQQTPKADRIANARQALIGAFKADDPATASLWMDSLARLEDDFFLPLQWDERWLLYFWQEAYGNLFTEVSYFNEQALQLAAYKTPPPEDSLFEILDVALYERRSTLFQQMSRNFLNQEERSFASIQLDYLLRLYKDGNELRDKMDAFIKHYPESRFKNYLLAVRPAKKIPSNKSFGAHILFQRGTWQGSIGSFVRPHTGVDFDLFFRYKHFNYAFFFGVGGQKLDQDVLEFDSNGQGYAWPKNDPTTLFFVGGEIGYDLFDRQKVRVWPSIGGGYASLAPPIPSEEEEPNPYYYDLFQYSSFFYQASLSADVKFPFKNAESMGLAKDSYQAIRATFGYRKLDFGSQNPDLAGDMTFFSIGYALHFRAIKRK